MRGSRTTPSKPRLALPEPILGAASQEGRRMLVRLPKWQLPYGRPPAIEPIRFRAGHALPRALNVRPGTACFNTS